MIQNANPQLSLKTINNKKKKEIHYIYYILFIHTLSHVVYESLCVYVFGI